MRHIVVLVHGIFDRGDKFELMKVALEKKGLEVIAPDLIPNSGRTGIEVLAVQLQAEIQSMRQPGDRVYLVGFSMGGIVCRYFLQRLGGANQVRRWITLSSPHHGTHVSHRVFGKGAAQMKRNSAFLNDLNADIDTIRNIPFLSLWTPYDLFILPAKSSRLHIGTSECMHVPVHPQMYSDSRVIRRVIEFLCEDASLREAVVCND